jgi:formylglycine-generating enzyme required for sulfatase activity
MKKVLAVTAALALLCLGVAAQAAITIDTVTVGDPDNAADTAWHSGNPNGQGSVSYTYNIGKYEVTAGQYAAFLNAVAKTDTYRLYSTGMANTTSGSGTSRSGPSGSYSYTVDAAFVNRPVNCVSFWDACRFTNWLSNGQKTGAQDATTTEDGTYTLRDYNPGDGRNIRRNATWKWAVTSEDEWYKAAYYKGGGTDAGYWLYPTQSDSTPGRDMNDPSGNNANYYVDSGPYPIDNGKCTTVVGQFQNSASAYGTFDQGGNVWEWNEAIPRVGSNYSYRGVRGGFFYEDDYVMQSLYRGDYHGPASVLSNVGFRVSQVVPEPSSIIVLLGSLTGLIGLKRRWA